MSLALLFLLSALPCGDLASARQRLLESAGSPAQVAAALEALDPVQGPALAAGMPGAAAPRERARIAADRLELACLFQAEPRGAALADGASLEEILRRPEFARAREGSGDLAERLYRRLIAWLTSLLRTRGAESYAEWTRVLVLAAALAVALLGALRLARWRRERAPVRSPAPAGAPPRELSTAEGLLERARSLSSRDGRAAIREALLALLASLGRRRLARTGTSSTNRELAAEATRRGAPPALAGQLARALRWYDRAFYSLEPVAAQDASRFVDEIAGIHRALEALP